MTGLKIRTTIEVDGELWRRAKIRALELRLRGVSQYIEQLIKRDLERDGEAVFDG